MPALTNLHAAATPHLGPYDLAVLGGGAAGSAAAIRAGRLGLTCLLADPLSFLGGTETGALVTPWMSNHVDGGPLNAGLGAELRQELESAGDARGYAINPEAMKVLLESKARAAGVELLYEATLVGVEARNEAGARRPTALVLATRRGLCRIAARFFIDATGDAAMAHALGLPTLAGREADGVHQPMSLRFVLGGIDRQAFVDGLRRDAGPDALRERNGLITNGRLDGHFLRLAQAEGWPEPWVKTFSLQFFEVPGRRGELWFNCPRVAGFDPLDPVSLSRAYAEGRALIAAYLRLFRNRIAGAGQCHLVCVAPMMGVREGRRIVGRYVLTADDFLKGRKFADGVCFNRYPIDIHNPSGQGLAQWTHLPDNQWHEIPFRCLVPLEARGLLVAGRCISSDFAAHASYRIIPNCRTLGEAAAVAARLATDQGVDVTEVDGVDVRRRMLELELLPPVTRQA